MCVYNLSLEKYSVSTHREENPAELVNHYFESKEKGELNCNYSLGDNVCRNLS